MSLTLQQIKLITATHASRCAEARLWGMKYRASINPPRAATGGFPYPARTCAEWPANPPKKVTRQGASMVLKAIARMAA